MGSTFQVQGPIREVKSSGELFVVSLEDADSGEVHQVEALESTLVSSGRLEDAVSEELEVGREVTVLAQDSSLGDHLPGALEIDLKPERPEASPAASATTTKLPATITGISRRKREIRVARDGEEHAIGLPSEVAIVLFEEADGVLWETPLLLEDVEVGMNVVRFGAAQPGGGPRVLLLAPGDEGTIERP